MELFSLQQNLQRPTRSRRRALEPSTRWRACWTSGRCVFFLGRNRECHRMLQPAAQQLGSRPTWAGPAGCAALRVQLGLCCGCSPAGCLGTPWCVLSPWEVFCGAAMACVPQLVPSHASCAKWSCCRSTAGCLSSLPGASVPETTWCAGTSTLPLCRRPRPRRRQRLPWATWPPTQRRLRA